MSSEKIPSKRALAFMAWMKAEGLNTNKVSDHAKVTYTTLASFVQGDTQSLKGSNEEKIAAAFDTTAQAIFSGAPSRGLARIIGRVGANPDGDVIMTSAHDSYDFAPVPPGGGAASAALEVHGHSMSGFADDGGLIYFEDQRTPPSADMLGSVVVLETEDGRVLVKKLLRGSKTGLFDLESLNGPTIKDTKIVWAAEITAIIPAKQARRIIRRQGEAA